MAPITKAPVMPSFLAPKLDLTARSAKKFPTHAPLGWTAFGISLRACPAV